MNSGLRILLDDIVDFHDGLDEARVQATIAQKLLAKTAKILATDLSNLSKITISSLIKPIHKSNSTTVSVLFQIAYTKLLYLRENWLWSTI